MSYLRKRMIFKFKFLIFISILIFCQSSNIRASQASTITGEIYGNITDLITSIPLIDAEVALSSGGKTQITATDVNGNYEFKNLAAGEYLITVDFPNYYTATQNVIVNSGIRTISDFAITKKRVNLTGIVTDSDTKNPVEGVMVTVIDGEKTYSQTTDSFGKYVISDLFVGDYIVEFALENYYREGSVSLSITEDEIVRDFVITRQKGEMTGKIINNIDKSALVSVIVVLSDGINNYTTATDANGIFTISDVYSGYYDMTVSLPGFEDKKFTDLLIQSENILVQDFELKKLEITYRDIEIESSKGVLRGRVKDPSGNNLSDAKIEIFNDDEHYTLNTDSNGDYIVENINEGKYTIIASKTNYSQIEIYDLYLLRGSFVAQDFVLEAISGTIFGKVTDMNAGTPIGFASITITNDDNTITTLADANGDYSMDFVPQGNYTVIASADDYNDSFAYDVIVFKGEYTRVDIALTRISDEILIDENIEMQSPIMLRSGIMPIIVPETPTPENDSVLQPNIESVDLDENVIKGTGTPGDTIEIIFSDGTLLETTVLEDGTWSITVPHLDVGDVIVIRAINSEGVSANVNVSIIDSLPSTGEYVDYYWINFTMCFMILLSILYFLIVTRKMTK